MNYNYNNNQNVGIPMLQQNQNSGTQQKNNANKYANVTKLQGLRISQYQMAPENINYGQQQMFPITEIPEGNQDIWQDPFNTNQIAHQKNYNEINYNNYY